MNKTPEPQPKLHPSLGLAFAFRQLFLGPPAAVEQVRERLIALGRKNLPGSLRVTVTFLQPRPLALVLIRVHDGSQ